MNERYVCVHGHFYQPPRENPWLGAIETQDSAYPFHDWNQRITDECYAPNASARILDERKRIVEIVSNYSRMSYNFGPTLLCWMEANRWDTYRAVVDADRESQQRFSGHGSALAQAYNHLILPLANGRDKTTQVAWGIADFERRFGRRPEGLWLPETAVDTETLEVLTEHGIAFTILAPHQAGRVRRIGEEQWHDVSGERVDSSRAYLARLPSGRSISLFFYNGPASRAVAFEGILGDGALFADRLLAILPKERQEPQLAHIASDGETYGHHHRFGEMALAYALKRVEGGQSARLTNYGEFLERHPAEYEVEIIERSSWSCSHGVERWRSDCGCATRSQPGWNQKWRAGLRDALDWLRDAVAPLYDREASGLLRDPWEARNDYVSVVLDRSADNVRSFLLRHAGRELDEMERIRCLELLEMQHNAMLMYTSCGWFFADVSDIEPIQLMMYAGRVVQLAEELSGDSLEEPFLQRLARAEGNVPQLPNGRAIYEKMVSPARLDLLRVGGHYAVSSLFEQHSDPARIYAFTVDQTETSVSEAGNCRLLVGRARVVSDVTTESTRVAFGVLHLGDHNINGGVRRYLSGERFQTMREEVTRAFRHGDLSGVIRLFDSHFGGSTYTLRSLFREEQRRIIRQVLESNLQEAEEVQRRFYRDNEQLMRFLRGLGIPVPDVFRSAAIFVLNADLARAFAEDFPDPDDIERLLDEAYFLDLRLDEAGLGHATRQALERLITRFEVTPADLELLQKLDRCTQLVRSLPFSVDLWTVQNVFYRLNHDPEIGRRIRQTADEPSYRQWVESFRALGRALGVVTPVV